MCRKERGCFPGQSAFRRRTGWEGERCIKADALGVELWPRFPTPLSGSWKKSSLIGILAVSFTLNVKVKQKCQASLLAKEKRVVSSRSGPGTLVSPGQGLPSLSPPPCGPSAPSRCLQAVPSTRHWLRVAQVRAPWPALPGRTSPSPPPRQHTAKRTSKCHGQGEPQHPNPKPLPPAQYCSLD